MSTFVEVRMQMEQLRRRLLPMETELNKILKSLLDRIISDMKSMWLYEDFEQQRMTDDGCPN